MASRSGATASSGLLGAWRSKIVTAMASTGGWAANLKVPAIRGDRLVLGLTPPFNSVLPPTEAGHAELLRLGPASGLKFTELEDAYVFWLVFADDAFKDAARGLPGNVMQMVQGRHELRTPEGLVIFDPEGSAPARVGMIYMVRGRPNVVTALLDAMDLGDLAPGRPAPAAQATAAPRSVIAEHVRQVGTKLYADDTFLEAAGRLPGNVIAPMGQGELRSKASAACDVNIRCAGEALYSAQFERARDCLREGRTVCVGAALAHVAQMGADLPGQEVEYRRRAARAQAEERARRAVEKDRRDAAAFDAKVDGVRKHLDAAAAKASRRLWLDAREALNGADADLAAFKGTKVETSERWRALHGRLDEIRGRIAPGVRGAEEARAAAQEAQRKREETIARRREAAEEAREASRRVRCCDGMLSPSCLCSGPSRGCCSHHGGICGCED